MKKIWDKFLMNPLINNQCKTIKRTKKLYKIQNCKKVRKMKLKTRKMNQKKNNKEVSLNRKILQMVNNRYQLKKVINQMKKSMNKISIIKLTKQKQKKNLNNLMK